MNKKQLRKVVVPGVWVQLRWDDAPDSIELVVARPEWEAGDVSITTFSPERGETWEHATHKQIVAVSMFRIEAPVLCTLH